MAEQKLKKHLTYLQMGKDALDKVKSSFVNRKNKKQAELWIVEQESKISDLELSLLETASSKEFDMDKIIDKKDDLFIAKRRLNIANETLSELF